MLKLPLLTMPSSRLQPSWRVIWKYRSASSTRCSPDGGQGLAHLGVVEANGSISNCRAMARRSRVGSREIIVGL